MSVLIKGMEMPKTCGDCECGSIFAGYKCMINNRAFEKYPLTHRQDWCPLIEVPEPHGNLIDADALEKEAQKRMLICDKNDNQFQKPYEVMRAIVYAPTIIPASECEERPAFLPVYELTPRREEAE